MCVHEPIHVLVSSFPLFSCLNSWDMVKISSHDIFSSKTKGEKNMHHKRHNKVVLRQCWGRRRSAGEEAAVPLPNRSGIWDMGSRNNK